MGDAKPTTWDVEYTLNGRSFVDENVFEARTELQAKFKAIDHVMAMLHAMLDEDAIHVTPSGKPKRRKQPRPSPCEPPQV